MKKYILLLLIVAGITGGCKYKEGSYISFRSPLKRIYGTYTIKTYNVNGEDSLSLFNARLAQQFFFYYKEDVPDYRLVIGTVPYHQYVCRWELRDNDNTLFIESGYGPYIGPFQYQTKINWDIIKLTNKKIKMTTTYNDKVYLIELEE